MGNVVTDLPPEVAAGAPADRAASSGVEGSAEAGGEDLAAEVPAPTAQVVEFAVRGTGAPTARSAATVGDDETPAPAEAQEPAVAGRPALVVPTAADGSAAVEPPPAADGPAAADPPAGGTAAAAAPPAAGMVAAAPAADPVQGTTGAPDGGAGSLPGTAAAEVLSAPVQQPGRRARRGPNKRDLRHQQTREAIVDAAAALFAERGFDAVSVLEIAQRAGVVEKTVFNHFPVKEGLVFEADPPMRAALVAAVRHRPAGESVSAAAGGFVVAAISQLGAPAAAAGVAEMVRVVRGSRTLQAREREILGMLTEALAEQITAETQSAPGDLEPWLAANAVLGLYSSLLELARDRVLEGASGPALVEELRARGLRGLALLQFGLAGYVKRR